MSVVLGKMKTNKKMLDEMNASITKMAESVTKLTESLTKQKESVDDNSKSLKQLAKEQKGFTRRAAMVNAVAKRNNDVFKFGKKTLGEFKEAGGTTLEYLGLLLSGSSEKLRLFGFEVQGIRRFLVGFMPPGTFSAMARFATIFNTIGGFIRFVKGDVDKLQGSMKGSLGMMKKLLPNFKRFDTLSSRIQGAQTSQSNLKDRIAKNPVLALDDPKKLANRLAGREEAEKTFRGQRRRELGNLMTGGFFRGIGSGRDFLGFKDDKESMKDRVGRSPMGRMIKAFIKGANWQKAFTFVITKLKGGIGKLMKGALMFFITVARFTLYFTLMITAAFILFHALKTPLMEAFEFLKSTLGFALMVIGEGFMTVFEGVKEIYTAFKNGDFFGVLMGVWTIVWGILQIAFGFLVGILGGLGALVVGFIVGLGKGVINFITDWGGGLRKNVGKIAILIGVIAGLIFGWPVVIGGLIIAAIGALFKKLKFFGDGGVATGGMAVVGERGPELVNLPKGSRVHSSTQSRKMTSSSNVFNITINARDTSDAELRRIADKIGNMVNNKVNRRTGSGTLG